MTQTKINFNLDGLDALRKGMGSTYRARVGIIGSKAAEKHPDGISNVELGVIQMFGSITNKIPPRDFLFMPIKMQAKEIVKKMKAPSVFAAAAAGDFMKVFGLLGAFAEVAIQEAFATRGFGQWAPNKPSTIDRKGSSSPLIDTAQLRRSISSDVEKASK